MKNYLILYFIFISTIFGNKIIHEKVQSVPYGISVPIKAFLNVSETNVHRFSLLYRPIGNIEFIEILYKFHPSLYTRTGIWRPIIRYNQYFIFQFIQLIFLTL